MSFAVVLILLSTSVFCLDGPNVCFDKNVGKRYCCSEYENIKDKCVACKIGFTSMSGKPCKPCNPGMYGKRCLNRCQCSVFQTCNNIYGCMNVDTITSSTINNSTSISVINRLVVPGAIENGNVTRTMAAYMAGVTGIILMLGVCYWYRKNRRICKHTKPNTAKESPDSVSINETDHYHTIDDNNLCSSNAHINHNTTNDVSIVDIRELCAVRNYPLVNKTENAEIHTDEICRTVGDTAKCAENMRQNTNFDKSSSTKHNIVVTVHRSLKGCTELETTKCDDNLCLKSSRMIDKSVQVDWSDEFLEESDLTTDTMIKTVNALGKTETYEQNLKPCR